MKAWTDLTKIPLPLHMQRLPRDERGYPVPKFATWVGGRPDFKQVNAQAWLECVRGDKCGICGNRLARFKALVGGPQSIDSRRFTDAPMHPQCAEYALRVCPFLAAPKFGYDKSQPFSQHMSPDRPEKFGMGITSDVQLQWLPDNTPVLVAWPWISPVRWWCQGKRLDHAE